MDILMDLPAPPLELHDHPELIKLKINDCGLCLIVTTEPYDWGGVQYTFSNLEAYSNHMQTVATVVSAFLIMRMRQPDKLVELADTGDPTYWGLMTLYELYFDRIPNVINESLGYHPVGRVGDCIGSVAQYYPEYYVPVVRKIRYSSSLLAPAYLVSGCSADIGFAYIAKYLDQLEDYKDEMSIILHSEFLNRVYAGAKPLASIPSSYGSGSRSVSIIGSDEPSVMAGVSTLLWGEYLDDKHQDCLLASKRESAHLGVQRWLGDLEEHL
jgi:hypothetical protein